MHQHALCREYILPCATSRLSERGGVPVWGSSSTPRHHHRPVHNPWHSGQRPEDVNVASLASCEWQDYTQMSAFSGPWRSSSFFRRFSKSSIIGWAALNSCLMPPGLEQECQGVEMRVNGWQPFCRQDKSQSAHQSSSSVAPMSGSKTSSFCLRLPSRHAARDALYACSMISSLLRGSHTLACLHVRVGTLSALVVSTCRLRYRYQVGMMAKFIH